MIKTERQLAVAKRKRDELLSQCDHLEFEDAEVYRELARDLQRHIEIYVSVRDGQVSSFAVDSVDGLAECAIFARIARGWSQRQLADELGVSEQNVQKSEATDYEKVGLSKLAEILDALGYRLQGSLRPSDQPGHEWSQAPEIQIGLSARPDSVLSYSAEPTSSNFSVWLSDRSLTGFSMNSHQSDQWLSGVSVNGSASSQKSVEVDL